VSIGKRSVMNLAAAMLLPFLAQAVIILLASPLSLEKHLRFDDPLSTMLVTFTVSSAVGFVFLVREFRWYSVIVGLVYFPMLAALLFYFSFAFSAFVFGAP